MTAAPGRSISLWDNPLTKKAPSNPESTSKKTFQLLWIDSAWNPPWDKSRLIGSLEPLYHHSKFYSGSTLRQTIPYGNTGYKVVQKLCKERRLEDALHLVKHMIQHTMTEEAQVGTFLCLLIACAKGRMLTQGKHVHALIVQSKCDSNILLANKIMDMYSKCGSLQDACLVFNAMAVHNVFSWTIIISAYADSGKCEEAINAFKGMQKTGIEPDKVVFIVVLKACARATAFEQGKQIHSLIVRRGFEQDITIQNILIDMYIKCGHLEEARHLFNNMVKRDVVSWNTMIGGYAQNELGTEAIILYQQMKQEHIQANPITFVCALKACAGIGALEQGKQIHSLLLEAGFHLNVIVQSTLVYMYVKCGCLDYARKLFNDMSERDVVSWNLMIAAYIQNGLGKEALALYEQMKQEGMQENKVTLICVLKACANIGALEQGKLIHSQILEKGFNLDMAVQNTLIDMYASCGYLKEAHDLFNNMSKRDVVSYNVMIAGYVQNGLGKKALVLYEGMKQEGLVGNKATFVCVLKACASIGALEQGMQTHSLLLEKGFHVDVNVESTLVDMYAKCGCLEDAHELFNNMRERNVVSWTAMIAGYAQYGLGKKALALYEQMEKEGMQADIVTFVCLLKACASIAALEQGKHIHSHIREKGLEQNLVVQNALVDMYAKCGCLRDAHELFNNMNERDLISWNTMIAGYAQNGLGNEALALYKQMEQESEEPNDITYICVLSACSHSGLIEEGFHVFDFMHKYSGVMPTSEHYACVVNLLGRAGLLAEAIDFTMKMPIQPNNAVWMSLLDAARNVGNEEMGQHAFHHMVKLEQENNVPCVNGHLYSRIPVQMYKVAEMKV